MPSRNRGVVSWLSRGRRRLAEVAGVWGLTAAIALLFAHVTAIGPILLRLSRTHGVHLGDVVFAVLAAVLAALVTRQLLRQR